MLLSLVDFEPSYKPLVSAAALLPMLLHWKCYWEHTRRDRYSASVLLIIGFNGKIRKILLILFYILSQMCSSGSCMNWLLPILYKKVLSQCDSSTLEVLVPHLHPGIHQSDSSCPGLGGKHTRMSFVSWSRFSSFLFHVVQVAFAPGGRVLAARAHPRLRWWTAGGVVAPKWSPSPSVRTAHTRLTCGHIRLIL